MFGLVIISQRQSFHVSFTYKQNMFASNQFQSMCKLVKRTYSCRIIYGRLFTLFSGACVVGVPLKCLDDGMLNGIEGCLYRRRPSFGAGKMKNKHFCCVLQWHWEFFPTEPNKCVVKHSRGHQPHECHFHRMLWMDVSIEINHETRLHPLQHSKWPFLLIRSRLLSHFPMLSGF